MNVNSSIIQNFRKARYMCNDTSPNNEKCKRDYVMFRTRHTVHVQVEQGRREGRGGGKTV